MSLEGLLNKSATVERNTASRAATGEVSTSWATVATVNCALQPASGNSVQSPHGQVLDVDYLAFFASGTDIRPRSADGKRDRLTIDNVKYLVLLTVDRAQGGKFLKAFLKRQA